MKKLFSLLLLATATLAVFNACHKDSAINMADPSIKPDLSVKVTASVAGFITDEKGAAVKGAAITAGTSTAITNEFGFFSIKDAALSKVAGSVKVARQGYFDGYRTFVSIAGSEAFVRLQLIPKKEIGSLSASAGGTLSTPDGASVQLPAEAVVTAATGAAYTGTVHVAAHWLNPADIQTTLQTMPGDLRAIDEQGYMKGLVTFGMVAVELSNDAGQKLQIATGKQATLTVPIPASMAAAAPATIPLWSFDDTTGLWKQEGLGTKTGDTYIGKVGHFSTWNFDVSYSLVPFTARVVDKNNQPLANTHMSVYPSGTAGGGCHGNTDSAGWIYAYAPANQSLSLGVANSCGGYLPISSFTSGSEAVDIGTVNSSVNPSIYTVNIIGTVVNCQNQPVGHGDIFCGYPSFAIRVPVHNGLINYNFIVCDKESKTLQLLAVDNDNAVQGQFTQASVKAGANNIGVLSACGVNATTFFHYTIDDKSTDFKNDEMTGDAGWNGSETPIALSGNTAPYHQYYFVLLGAPSVGGSHQIGGGPVANSPYSNSTFNYVDCPITEYGKPQEFVAGSFSGFLKDSSNVLHPVSCSFRLRRKQ